jgi:hypothetical protein
MPATYGKLACRWSYLDSVVRLDGYGSKGMIMDDFSDCLYRALAVELQLAARKKGITLQQELEQRLKLGSASRHDEAWGDVVDRALIGSAPDKKTETAE